MYVSASWLHSSHDFFKWMDLFSVIISLSPLPFPPNLNLLHNHSRNLILFYIALVLDHEVIYHHHMIAEVIDPHQFLWGKIWTVPATVTDGGTVLMLWIKYNPFQKEAVLLTTLDRLGVILSCCYGFNLLLTLTD